MAAGQRSGGKGGQLCAARATPRWLGPSVGTGDERWLPRAVAGSSKAEG